MVKLTSASRWARHVRTASRTGYVPYLVTLRPLTTSFRSIPSPTAETLSSALADLPQGSTTCYFLDPRIPAAEIQPLIAQIQRAAPNSIGSFAPALGDAPAVGLATFTPGEGEQVHTFRSDLVGRAPASVGRWQRSDLYHTLGSGMAAPRKEAQGGGAESQAGSTGAIRERSGADMRGDEVGGIERALVDGQGRWDELWKSEETLGGRAALPVDLANVKSPIKSLLILSDGLPAPLLSALAQNTPNASLLGLITHATPFLTGRPYTLLRGNSVFEDGAVGLAVSGNESKGWRVGVAYAGLEALGEVVEIEGSQGNLLLRLAASSPLTNPTQSLISHINAYRASQPSTTSASTASSATRGISIGKGEKDEEYYLALWARESDSAVQPDRIVRIQSGDPSRGALALEMEEPLLPGQRVQFMHRPRGSARVESSGVPHTSLSFRKLAEDDTLASQGASQNDSASPVSGVHVGSEGGFFFSSGTAATGQAANVCRVTGARGWILQ